MKRRIFIIIGSVVLVLIVSGAVVGALVLIKPVKKTTTQPTTSSTQPSVITSFVKDAPSLPGLSGANGELGVRAQNKDESASLYASMTNIGGYVSVKADEIAGITSAKPFTQASIDSATSTVTTYLNSHGYKKEAPKVVPPNTIALFTSPSGSCNLVGTVKLSTLQLACIYSDHLTTSTNDITSALKKWSGFSAAKFSYINQFSASSNDSAHTVLLLNILDQATGKTVTNSPLFTKDSGKEWTFVTDITVSDQRGNGGKFATSAATDKILADKTYGPLVMQLLGGSNTNNKR